MNIFDALRFLGKNPGVGGKLKPTWVRYPRKGKNIRCLECGGPIPRGRLYTCSQRCKARRDLRLKKLIDKGNARKLQLVQERKALELSSEAIFGSTW